MADPAATAGARDTSASPLAEHPAGRMPATRDPQSAARSGPRVGNRHRKRSSRAGDLRRLLAMPAPALLAGGAATCMGGTMAATWLADHPLKRQTRSFDDKVLDMATRARHARSKPLDLAMSLLTGAGEPRTLYPLTALAAGWWVTQKRTADAALLALALLGSAGLDGALKKTVKRPRPIWKLPLPRSGFSGPSFPSDHAAMSVATYGMIALLATRHSKLTRQNEHDNDPGEQTQPAEPVRRSRRAAAAMWAAALSLCALIGWSRLYEGVHNPSDVLGGWLAGGIWLLACSLAARGTHLPHNPLHDPADRRVAEGELGAGGLE